MRHIRAKTFCICAVGIKIDLLLLKKEKVHCLSKSGFQKQFETIQFSHYYRQYHFFE